VCSHLSYRVAMRRQRVAVVTRDSSVIAERTEPRAAFEGNMKTSPWDPLHRVYFNGYAL
jgi:hypothetical protein